MNEEKHGDPGPGQRGERRGYSPCERAIFLYLHDSELLCILSFCPAQSYRMPIKSPEIKFLFFIFQDVEEKKKKACPK